MAYEPTDTAPRKLVLSKPSLESLTLYAHGLISLSEMCQRLSEENISVSHVNTEFTSETTLIQAGPKENNLFFHLTRLSKETDERGFPINDETCVVNL